MGVVTREARRALHPSQAESLAWAWAATQQWVLA